MNTKKKICFENIICLYGMMNEIASEKMTAYKSDLEIDFEDMKAREKDGFSFLWAVRETGTWFRPFQTNGECNFNNKEDYKTFMYSVLDLEGYIGIHQDYYIINVNYHGEYSIQHVSKLNAKKAIDTCLENFNKYRLAFGTVKLLIPPHRPRALRNNLRKNTRPHFTAVTLISKR